MCNKKCPFWEIAIELKAKCIHLCDESCVYMSVCVHMCVYMCVECLGIFLCVLKRVLVLSKFPTEKLAHQNTLRCALCETKMGIVSFVPVRGAPQIQIGLQRESCLISHASFPPPIHPQLLAAHVQTGNAGDDFCKSK